MNPVQRQENARTLSSLLGLAEDEVIDRLNGCVQITWSQDDDAARNIGAFTAQMLRRTFQQVGDADNAAVGASWELLINGAPARSTSAKTLHCAIDSCQVYCGFAPGQSALVKGEVPVILCLLAACFVAAQVANYALGLPADRVSSAGINLDFREWPGVQEGSWHRPTDLGPLQVAGGGAVGNAVLYALQHLPVVATGSIIDPKPVSKGILNRCLWFDETDVGKPKAQVLEQKLATNALGLALNGIVKTMQQARQDVGEFNCMVVGVDSRRARRSLQMEVPGEVFDASTTGIDEIVFHHNRQHDGRACMACIYAETIAEQAFSAHIAEMLNVTPQEIDEGFISAASTTSICARYPELKAARIQGMAYDSLFRQLCAAGTLVTPEQKQVLAPFAFVSQLAGTVLAIELFLRRQDPSRGNTFNYWRVNPWRGLFASLQQQRLANPDCEVCSRDDYRYLAQTVWDNPPA